MQLGWYDGSAGSPAGRPSALETRRCTTGSFGVWSCSITSAGHLSWMVMLVTFCADPARNWLWYGVTTSSCVVEMTVYTGPATVSPMEFSLVRNAEPACWSAQAWQLEPPTDVAGGTEPGAGVISPWVPWFDGAMPTSWLTFFAPFRYPR